jgi:SIR2-like domain
MVATIPSTWSQVPLIGQTNIIKLHGSFNWRATGSGQSAMVIGTSKTSRIAGSSLLSWYFDIFRAVLNQGNVKLMVVGYGFGEDHINEVIADAVKTTGLKVYFWDTSPNLQMMLAGKHRGGDIWQGYMGSLTDHMNQVLPPDQSITTQCRSLFNNFFGVKLP